MTEPATWDERAKALWAEFDALPEEDFLRRHEALMAELAAEDPRASFERACAQDSTGNSDTAVPLYRQALAKGLGGLSRRRAVIQLSSSLRNVGQAEESVALLTREQAAGSDELDDALAGFLALCLAEVGQERKALSLALVALARHLPRYNRSLANYARDLIEE